VTSTNDYDSRRIRLECQRRKSRCSGIVPCSLCSKTGKDCVFEDRPQRTRLTRQNLDEAEQRCLALETLLRTLSPDLDVEKLLKKQRKRCCKSVSPSTSPEVDAIQHVGSVTPSNEYEWHESPLSPLQDSPQESKVLGDGMASLPSKPDGTGYLGSSSGSSLLETISALLPLASDATAAEGPKLQQSPSGPENSRLPQRTSISMLGGNLAFQAEMGRLIDAYFIFYNTSYPILHERTLETFTKLVLAFLQSQAGISSSTWFWPLFIGYWAPKQTTANRHTTQRHDPGYPPACWSRELLAAFRLVC
jgi:transcriptional regulatory protein GAL4